MRKRILFIFLLVLCLCAVPVSAAALGKVSGVKAKQSGEKVKVTWNTAAGAKGYQVYQKTGSEKFHRIKTTGKKSYTVRGLTPGNTYYFRVRAYADSSGKKEIRKILFFRKDHDQKQLCSRKQSDHCIPEIRYL